MCQESNAKSNKLQEDVLESTIPEQHATQAVYTDQCQHSTTEDANNVDILPIQMSSDGNDKLLTAMIKQSKNCQDLVALIFGYKDQMNEIHISAASHKLAKLRPKIPPQQMRQKLKIVQTNTQNKINMNKMNQQKEIDFQLQEQIESALHILAVNYQIQADSFSERCMTNTLWGLSKAGYVQQEFYLTWLEVAIHRIPQLLPRQICLCMWSLGNKGWTGHQLENKFFQMVVEVSTIILPKFEMIDISMLLWAIAKNSQFVRDPSIKTLFELAAKKIAENAQHTTAQGITNILWAYGLQRFLFINKLQEMLEFLGKQISLRRDEFAVEQIGNIAWSFMRLHFYRYEIFDVLIQISTDQIQDLQPLALSNLLYSFSWFKNRYGDIRQFSNFFIQASNVYLQCMHMFEPLPFANVVQSYASMIDPKNDELYNTCIIVLDYSYQKVLLDFEKFDGYCISLITWGYGKMCMGGPEFYQLVKNRIQFNSEIFTCANLITILYGICLGKYFDNQLIRMLIQLIMQFSRGTFKPRQIEMLEQCFEILSFGDGGLDNIMYKCILKFKLNQKQLNPKNKNFYQPQKQMHEHSYFSYDEQNWW